MHYAKFILPCYCGYKNWTQATRRYAIARQGKTSLPWLNGLGDLGPAKTTNQGLAGPVRTKSQQNRQARFELMLRKSRVSNAESGYVHFQPIPARTEHASPARSGQGPSQSRVRERFMGRVHQLWPELDPHPTRAKASLEKNSVRRQL